MKKFRNRIKKVSGKERDLWKAENGSEQLSY